MSRSNASRVAFSQILPDEKKESAVAFLEAALTYYASLGITVERVMTDNGPCYASKAFAHLCRERGLKHVRTRPYTPKTNGKAERFIQTALREWAYAIAYPTSDLRAAQLPQWLHRYNWQRPHGSLKSNTPISRLGLTEDNLLEAPQLEPSRPAPRLLLWGSRFRLKRSHNGSSGTCEKVSGRATGRRFLSRSWPSGPVDWPQIPLPEWCGDRK